MIIYTTHRVSHVENGGMVPAARLFYLYFYITESNFYFKGLNTIHMIYTTVLAEFGILYSYWTENTRPEIPSFVREQFRRYVMAGTDNDHNYYELLILFSLHKLGWDRSVGM